MRRPVIAAATMMVLMVTAIVWRKQLDASEGKAFDAAISCANRTDASLVPYFAREFRRLEIGPHEPYLIAGIWVEAERSAPYRAADSSSRTVKSGQKIDPLDSTLVDSLCLAGLASYQIYSTSHGVAPETIQRARMANLRNLTALTTAAIVLTGLILGILMFVIVGRLKRDTVSETSGGDDRQ